MRAAIPVILFLVAGWLGTRPVWEPPEVGPRPSFDAAALSTAPLRPARAAPDTIVVGGIAQRCTDCHMIFESAPRTLPDLRQHEDVRLDHGLNDRCLNCHARSDRGSLELHDGSLVPLGEAQLLCAKCHGPTFRDWEKGVHGRTNGAWDARSGDQRRLRCVECHDPHAPRMKALVPLPGPRTWRMGHPGRGSEVEGPLGRFGRPAPASRPEHDDG